MLCGGIQVVLYSIEEANDGVLVVGVQVVL